MKHLVKSLAGRFAEYLRRDLTTDELVEVISLNKAETDPMICHSHDFLDANMTMHEAFTDVVGREPFLSDEPAGLDAHQADVDLFNEAWNIAKRADFLLSPKLRGPVTIFGREFKRVGVGSGIALIWSDPQGGEILITNTGGDELPTAHNWMIGFYDAEGNSLGIVTPATPLHSI